MAEPEWCIQMLCNCMWIEGGSIKQKESKQRKKNLLATVEACEANAYIMWSVLCEYVTCVYYVMVSGSAWGTAGAF